MTFYRGSAVLPVPYLLTCHAVLQAVLTCIAQQLHHSQQSRMRAPASDGEPAAAEQPMAGKAGEAPMQAQITQSLPTLHLQELENAEPRLAEMAKVMDRWAVLAALMSHKQLHQDRPHQQPGMANAFTPMRASSQPPPGRDDQPMAPQSVPEPACTTMPAAKPLQEASSPSRKQSIPRIHIGSRILHAPESQKASPCRRFSVPARKIEPLPYISLTMSARPLGIAFPDDAPEQSSAQEQQPVSRSLHAPESSGPGRRFPVPAGKIKRLPHINFTLSPRPLGMAFPDDALEQSHARDQPLFSRSLQAPAPRSGRRFPVPTEKIEALPYVSLTVRRRLPGDPDSEPQFTHPLLAASAQPSAQRNARTSGRSQSWPSAQASATPAHPQAAPALSAAHTIMQKMLESDASLTFSFS